MQNLIEILSLPFATVCTFSQLIYGQCLLTQGEQVKYLVSESCMVLILHSVCIQACWLKG